MNGTILDQLYAEARRLDILADIERRQRIVEATGSRNRPATGATRRLIGRTLVRAGERIGGTANLPTARARSRSAA